MNIIKHRGTFAKVLWNCDDQVIVRELLKELVPEDIQHEVVKRFNLNADEHNARVLKGKED